MKNSDLSNPDFYESKGQWWYHYEVLQQLTDQMPYTKLRLRGPFTIEALARKDYHFRD